MGIIDKCTYTLICPQCEISESASVLEKGSGWGGSSWEARASFAKFTTEWQGGGKSEPELLSATCKVCGSEASKTSKNSQ